MKLFDQLHQQYIFSRRVEVLAERLAPLLPEGGRVLDVGCGDGRIDQLISGQRPGVMIEGIDVLVRPETFIPVTAFDGTQIPFEDHSFDAVMFVDVLHHTDNPVVLLKEATRIARRAILLKDHCMDGFLAGPTLRFMDWIGNARHGVRLPYNYWSEQRWRDAFARLNLTVDVWQPRLGLYTWPLSLAFERRLHFVARLTPPRIDNEV